MLSRLLLALTSWFRTHARVGRGRTPRLASRRSTVIAAVLAVLMVSTVVTIAMPARATVDSPSSAVSGSGVTTDTPQPRADGDWLPPSGGWNPPSAIGGRNVYQNVPLSISVQGNPPGIELTPHPSSLSTLGQLPPGITVALGSVFGASDIKGTPTTRGSYTFQIIYHYDGLPIGSIASPVYTFHVISSAPTLGMGNPPSAKLGQEYYFRMDVFGPPPLTVKFESGSLPPGIAFDAGVLSGTATRVGKYEFRIGVSSPHGSASKAYSLEVPELPVIDSAPPPTAKARESYSHQFAAQNSNGSTWQVVAGTQLPKGLTLDRDGRVSGIPTRVGVTRFVVRVDATGGVAEKAFEIRVNPGAPLSAKFGERFQFDGIGNQDVLTVVLDNGKVRGFAENDVASHPTFADKSYVAVELRSKNNTLLKSGTVKGNESAAAVAESMQWAYSDGDVLVASHQEADARFTAFSGGKAFPQNAAVVQRFVIKNHKLVREVVSITSPAPAAAKVGIAYTHQLSGTGAAAWSVSKGALPVGLTLDEKTGLISGTPTKAGSVTFTVQVSNNAGGSASKEYTLLVAASKLPVITSEDLPQAKVGAPYTHQFTASDAEGGVWSMLPAVKVPGLSLNSATGVLSGVPG